MKIGHYDDGKGKHQSHEISLVKDSEYEVPERLRKEEIYNMDIFQLTGYGATKKEAIENFCNKAELIIDELEAMKFMLRELAAGSCKFDLVEIDCTGEEVK